MKAWIRMALVVFIFSGISLVIGAPAADDLESQARSALSSLRGRSALAAKNLKTGETIQINGATRVKTASVIKLPIMVEVFYQVKEGKLKLDDRVLFSESDKVQGSGILQDLQGGLRLTLRD